MFGNKRFDVDDADNIIIDDVWYVSTPGLYELIFKRIPDNLLYTEDDMNKYKSMLLATNVHKHKHQSQGRLLSNRGYKYKYVITPLIIPKKQKKKSGKGLPHAIILNDDWLRALRWSQWAGSSTIARRFAPNGQQRSRQRDHWGTSRSRSYYKLNHVSMKRISRKTLSRKNTLFSGTLCIMRWIMKKRSERKREKKVVRETSIRRGIARSGEKKFSAKARHSLRIRRSMAGIRFQQKSSLHTYRHRCVEQVRVGRAIQEQRWKRDGSRNC